MQNKKSKYLVLTMNNINTQSSNLTLHFHFMHALQALSTTQ